MKWTRVIGQSALLAAVAMTILLQACGQSAGSLPFAAIKETIPQAAWPAFPVDRAPNAIFTLQQTGAQATQMSAGAVINGNSLNLPGSTGVVEYGLFQFSSEGDPLIDLTVVKAPQPSASFYVGLANYDTMRWTVQGPFSGDSQTLLLTTANFTSPNDNVYAFVAVFGGETVELQSVSLTLNRGKTFFVLSGQVTENAAPLAGVDIALTGAAAGNTQTDASGNYSFTGLGNGAYTVTPTRNGYSFNPLDSLQTVSGANVPGVDFSGTAAASTYTISGTITDITNGIGINGVNIALTGAADANTTTGIDGSYSFSGLSDGAYTVTPTLAPWNFTPVDRSVNVAGADVPAQDFTGSQAAATYTLSGSITDDSGIGIAGIDVSLTGDNSANATTLVDGSYIFTSLLDGNYTVTPGDSVWTFAPLSRSVTVAGSDRPGQDFTGSQVAATYTISGNISDGANDNGINGVSVALSGDGSANTTTSVDGSYSFAGLPDGNYSVTPTDAAWVFTPPSRSVTVAGANQPGQDFAGAALVPTYTISGTITNVSNGNGIDGVNVALSGAGSAATSTNSSGQYSFAGLTDGNYTVTPSDSAWTFTPLSRSLTVSGADQPAQDFTGTLVVPTYTISGTITNVSNGNGIDGVNVALTGAGSAATSTNSSGQYSFAGLTDGNYTVTPSDSAWTFTPLNRSVTVAGADRTAQDFTGNLSAPPTTYETGDGLIKALVYLRCSPCHISESQSGRNFSTYANITSGDTEDRIIFRAVQEQTMPPGGMPQSERDKLQDWMDDGFLQ